MKKLFLIGYRGTGKTVIGKNIARKLGKQFVDTDELIVKIAGKTIPKIFSEDGEDKFRKIETLALKKACEENFEIISCGGGIITREENINILKENGLVCLLKADSKTIFKRIYKDENRPPLTDKNPFEEIILMLEKRKELYERAKDFEIDTTNNSIEECVELILKELE
jgi:shikimate kinase